MFVLDQITQIKYRKLNKKGKKTHSFIVDHPVQSKLPKSWDWTIQFWRELQRISIYFSSKCNKFYSLSHKYLLHGKIILSWPNWLPLIGFLFFPFFFLLHLYQYLLLVSYRSGLGFSIVHEGTEGSYSLIYLQNYWPRIMVLFLKEKIIYFFKN